MAAIHKMLLTTERYLHHVTRENTTKSSHFVSSSDIVFVHCPPNRGLKRTHALEDWGRGNYMPLVTREITLYLKLNTEVTKQLRSASYV